MEISAIEKWKLDTLPCGFEFYVWYSNERSGSLWQWLKKINMAVVYKGISQAALARAIDMTPSILTKTQKRTLFHRGTLQNCGGSWRSIWIWFYICCNGAPDFVIEIISPSNPADDYVRKLYYYKNYGVREYWIVDPRRKTVTVNYFEGNMLTIQYSFDAIIKVNIYDDLYINFSDIADMLNI